MRDRIFLLICFIAHPPIVGTDRKYWPPFRPPTFPPPGCLVGAFVYQKKKNADSNTDARMSLPFGKGRRKMFGWPRDSVGSTAVSARHFFEALLCFLCLCRTSDAIFGGANATGSKLVYTVAIGNSIVGGGSHACVGTLLSNQWVVTTASCVSGIPSIDMAIHAGCESGATSTCSQVVYAEKTLLHPCFKNTSNSTMSLALRGDDIALVKLQAPGVAVGSQTKFPLLDTVLGGAYTTPADTGFINGWGITGYDAKTDLGVAAQKLQSLVMPFIPLSTCKAKFLELNGSYSTGKDFSTPKVVCAGDGEGHTPCDGDEGSPLIQTNAGGVDVLVGIFVHLTPSPQMYPQVDRRNPIMQPNLCTTKKRYAVFHRVAAFRSWLQTVISTEAPGVCSTERTSPSLTSVATQLGHSTSDTVKPGGVAPGRTYSWGECVPSAGKFLGGNIADSNFRVVYGEKGLMSSRGEKFSVDWIYDDGHAATAPVGGFPKSPAVTQYNLFDMVGNVREWTRDRFDRTLYSRRAYTHVVNPLSGEVGPWGDVKQCTAPDCTRVVRGGSWADSCCHHTLEPEAGRDVRADTRAVQSEKTADDRTGFRMVCYLRKGVKKGSVQLPYVEDVPSVQAFRLREVAAGIFTMGTAAAGASVAAKPPHHVHVDKFWISSTEITRKEFASFVSKTNYSPTSVANGCVSMSSPGSNVPNQDYTWASPGFNQTDAHPVVCVSWTDATAFAKWVDGNVGDAWNCTLPTEAQWEKAAKGTSRGLDKCESNWYEASAAWQSPYAETASPDLASITIKSPENSLKGVEHSVIAVVGVSVVGARSTDIISMEIFCKNCTLGFTHTVGLTFTKNAKDSVSFYGAVSVINNALLGLSYKGDMSFSGVDTLSFKLGAQISVVGVIVQFVNTVPLLSNRNRSVIVHEDTPREFYFLQQPDSQSPMEKYGFVAVSDPDSPSLTIEATVKFGTLSFETMSGSVAQLNEGIINSTFTPALDWNSLYNGPDVVTFSVTDAANNTAITYVDFVVLPVNDLPAIGAPENLWLPEDTIYKFHNTSVVDIDIEESSSAVLEVNVSVGGGTLGLGSSAGLWANDITFSNNRTGISMRGSSLSINAALKSMEYRSFPEFSGQEDIVISATDFGKTGASSGVIVSKTITALILAVNNPPVLSAPTSIEVAEDTQYYINNIVLWDRDSGLDDIEVQLSCSKGVIFVNKTSYYVKTKGLGTDHVVLTGPVAFMADSLLQVSYMGGIDASGKDTIRVVANDLGHSGSGIAHSVEKNIRVSISPVNDPPVITAPASVKGQEDQPVIIEGISFSDADASEALGSFVELHISAIHGSAVPSDTDGIWSTGNGRYRGGIEALTKALSKLLYSPKQDWAGMDTITLVLDDLGNFGAGKNGSANAHIAVEVSPSNDAPTVSLPTSNYSQAIEDTALSITGMAVDDKDFGNGHFKASLVARDGTIAIPAHGSGGVTVTTKNIMILDTSQPPLYGGSFPLRSAFATVVTGPFAEVKIALANVTYKPNLNWYGIDSVEVSVTDDNDLLGKTSFLVKVLPIDDPPSLEFGQTSYNFSQNILSPSLDMTIVDVDSEGVVAVHLYVQKGNLVLQSNSTVGLSLLTNLTSKELMFQGNIESVNSALATIRYQSAFEYVGNDTVITQVKDGENNWEFEQSISIFDFNNAPLIACTNEIVVNENELATIGQFFNLTDVDAGTGAIAVLVSSQQGNLSLDSSSHKGVVVEIESQKISIFGPLPLVNGLLHKVQYVALKYYGGIDSIVVSVNDRGFSGPDGAKQATMTVAVVIEPTNDPPSILTSFGVLTFSENTNTRVEGVTVHDADAGEDFRSLLTVNLTVSHGKLSFLGIPGLFMNEHPQANGQNVLSLQGGLARLNSALGNLKYKGKKEWHGKDILLIMVSDNGNTGSGGAKFASANVTFIVEPLDNAPVLSCPLEQMSLEDTPLLVDFISLHDADAPANALVEVNVSVKIGEISFGSHVGTRVVQNKNIYTISGTHDSVNALLKSGFNFKPAKDFNSRRSGTNDRISITAEDHGGSTVSCATTIVVEPVNDKPVIKFQESPKRASEDTDLKMLGISISDPDANDFQESVLEVNISVGKGTITFAEKGGLSFLSSSEFKGGLKAVQNAISNVVYTPEPEWSGTDTLELTVSDGGKLNGTAFGSLSINVESVQDFPVLACPIETVYGDEDAYAIWISGCSITCPESAISVHQVDVSVTHGTTSLPNITVDTLALHRDLLSNFSYTPARDFCGQDLISISITGGSTIQVYAVTSCTNDVPQIHVPVLFEAMEDVDVVLPGVSVHDSDVNDMVMVHVGTLKGSIVWQSGSGLHRMNGSTYTGNVVDMNHALSNLKYSAPRNWFGTDAIRFTVQDKIGTSSSKEIKMIVHAFNDAPELQIPSSCTIDSLTEIASEDTNHLLRGISVHDVDGDNAKSNITVTLFVDYGNLNVTLVKGDNVIVTSTPTAKNDGRNARTLAAVAWMPNGGNKLVLRGLESGVNKALQHLYYTPSNNFNGMWASPANTSSIRNPNPGGALERMSLKVEDNEGASSEKTCYISVSAINDAPVITAPSSFSTEEDRAVALKGISVEDVDIEEIRGARLEVIIDSTIGTVTVDRHSGLRFFEGTSKGGEKKAPTLEVQNITSWAEKTKEVQQIKVLRSINSSSPLVGSFTIAKHASSWSTRAVFKGYWKCKFQSYGSIGRTGVHSRR